VFALDKDASSTPSPRIITPDGGTGIPQSPVDYNGETAAHVQVTAVVTESSPASYTEPPLSVRDSESDSNTAKELV